MKQFRCGDVIPGCKATFEAETEQGILSQVVAHAARDHGMIELPAELPGIVLAHVHEIGTRIQ